jgi:hypothetical protein
MRPAILLGLVWIMVSCSSPKSELLQAGLPADSVIQHDEMVKILVDMHLVEAALDLQRTRAADTPQLTQNYYQWLCRKYHISFHRLRENINYYKMDPASIGKIYKEVSKELNDMAKQKISTPPAKLKAY